MSARPKRGRNNARATPLRPPPPPAWRGGTAATAPAAARWRRPARGPTSAPSKAERSLGTRQIEGVTATGRKTITTIPVGQIGNDRPIEITDERWESEELKLLVLSRHHDPRTGDVRYRLTNVSRAEPASYLFTVPGGLHGGRRSVAAPSSIAVDGPAASTRCCRSGRAPSARRAVEATIMLLERAEHLDKRRCRTPGGGESESDGRRVVRVIEIRQQMIGVDLILEHVDAGLEVVDLDGPDPRAGSRSDRSTLLKSPDWSCTRCRWAYLLRSADTWLNR